MAASTIAFATAVYVFLLGPLCFLYDRPSIRPVVEPMTVLYRPLECRDSCDPKLHCHLAWEYVCVWNLDGTLPGCPVPSLKDARTSSGVCSPSRYVF